MYADEQSRIGKTMYIDEQSRHVDRFAAQLAVSGLIDTKRTHVMEHFRYPEP
jgi:hypothetical protein